MGWRWAAGRVGLFSFNLHKEGSVCTAASQRGCQGAANWMRKPSNDTSAFCVTKKVFQSLTF